MGGGIRGGTREACFLGKTTFRIGVELEEGKGQSLRRYSYAIEVLCGDHGSAPRVSSESLYETKGWKRVGIVPQDGSSVPPRLEWRQPEIVFDSHP